MKITTKELTLCAVLSALALALSYMESFFPLVLLVPLPGVKLGLANIVTLYALYAIGFPSALAILLVRCTLGALFAGNASALLFSPMGGGLSILVMIVLRHLPGLSIYGVSIGGAAAHNIGQLLGYAPQELGIYPDLSVAQNLAAFGEHRLDLGEEELVGEQDHSVASLKTVRQASCAAAASGRHSRW